MKDQGTALEVRTEIMLQLESWTNDNPQQTSKETFSENQQQIGWDRMMDGWLLCSWQDHQGKFGSVSNHGNQACGG